MTDPRTFFTETVPQKFAEVKDQLTEAQKAIEMAVGVDLSGEGGGQWTIRFKGGELEVEEGLADDAAVVLRQPVESWRQALTGEGGLADQSVDFAGTDPTKLKPALAERVRQINGTIRFVVLEGDEEVWEMTLLFGPNAPEEPQTVVQIQEEDAALIRSGQLMHQQAFMMGKIRITGDMNLAMQVGSLSMIQ